MITKWAKTMLKTFPAGVLPSSKGVSSLEVFDVDGASLYMAALPARQNLNRLVTEGKREGIAIGSDGRAAADTDYFLYNQLTGNLNGISGSVAEKQIEDASGNTVAQFDVTVINNGADSIVVREIGSIAVALASGSAGGNAREKYFLLDRTVLSEPVTIAAGETAIIRYQIKTMLN